MFLNNTAAIRLSLAVENFAGHFEADRIGVAVSGGGDSTALFAMLSEWCNARGLELLAVSVDHGLRPEAESECVHVQELADSLGHRHAIIACNCIGAGGNLQEAVRRARYALIAEWAKSEGLGEVALAHTKDDQAETFLLNLSRGSGIDGLSAMPPRIRRRGLFWIRPLLDVGRKDLRSYLKQKKLAWVEDPSNEDIRFDRVKARQMLDTLAPLGLSVERLAETSRRMQAARHVLESAADRAVREIATVNEVGEVRFSSSFWDLPDETSLRLAAQALKFLSGAEYRPRLSSLVASLESARAGSAATLSGCIVSGFADGRLQFSREPAACPPGVPADEVWDGRWKLEGGPVSGDAVIGALTEAGLRRCPNWRSTGHSRSGLVCSPALWSDDELVSAPLAGFGCGWKVKLLVGKDDLVNSLQSV